MSLGVRLQVGAEGRGGAGAVGAFSEPPNIARREVENNEDPWIIGCLNPGTSNTTSTRHSGEAVVVDREVLSFVFLGVDEFQPECLTRFAGAEFSVASDDGGVGSVPYYVALLEINELVAEAVDHFALAVLVE